LGAGILAPLEPVDDLAGGLTCHPQCGAEPTGLSPVRNAVSQYGITPFRAGYRVATIAFAAAGIALAAGIGLALGSGGRPVVVLLVIFAIARAAISWFPMDVPGSERTSTGQMHGLLAIGAFAAATGAAWHRCCPTWRTPACCGRISASGNGRTSREASLGPPAPGAHARVVG